MMDRAHTSAFLDSDELPPSIGGGLTGDSLRSKHEEFLFLLQRVGGGVVERRSASASFDWIEPNDTLIVVDLQEDFMPPSGSFAVPDGEAIVKPICELVQAFIDHKAVVYCSRDYHPVFHCSFDTHGGMFPPHCIQGTKGSYFVPELAATIQPHMHSLLGPVFVVYKGFSPDVDSFGAVSYDDTAMGQSPRLARRGNAPHCSSAWTGSFLLFSSNATADCNAPPDVISVLDKRLLHDHLRARATSSKRGRMYVVGVALDYCVLDTAVNAASLKDAAEVHAGVTILLDYCRPAHALDVGPFGSGFFTDPTEFAAQCKDKVALVTFE